MKQTILFSVLILFSFSGFAQNQKGDISVNIQVAPFLTKGDSKDFGLISLAGVEFFASPKFSLATHFFTSNNTLIKNDSGSEINSIGLLTSGQYYFLNLEKWVLFGQVGFGFGKADYRSSFIENQSLFIGHLGLGANYMLSEKLFIKLTTPYFIVENTTSNFTEAKGVTLFAGLGYMF
jgi:hypothetical protein